MVINFAKRSFFSSAFEKGRIFDRRRCCCVFSQFFHFLLHDLVTGIWFFSIEITQKPQQRAFFHKREFTKSVVLMILIFFTPFFQSCCYFNIMA